MSDFAAIHHRDPALLAVIASAEQARQVEQLQARIGKTVDAEERQRLTDWRSAVDQTWGQIAAFLSGAIGMPAEPERAHRATVAARDSAMKAWALSGDVTIANPHARHWTGLIAIERDLFLRLILPNGKSA